MRNDYNYIPLGRFDQLPEGRKAIVFNVDMSATLNETVDIGLGIQKVSCVRSLYVFNPSGANLRIEVVSSGQIIKVDAGKTTYVPVFTSMPCRLLFSSDVFTNARIQCIAGNFNFDIIKPNTTSGGGGTSYNFVDGETPTGAIDGVNDTFTITHMPSPLLSLCLFLNGQKLRRGVGYTNAGNNITFLAGYIPQVGDTIETFYRY